MHSTEVYTVESHDDGTYQSVFPSELAEHSQMHSSIEDAVEYIKEVCPNVKVVIGVTSCLK